jgi:hypothetical protein
MKYILLLLILLCTNASASLTNLKFGRAQIADSQWNVQACTQTATCQIYSKNPGTVYKIPWHTGQLTWATGDYVAFAATGNSTNPWNAVQYTSSGTQKAVMGTGHIINMGADYFFFVGNDNDTGQLFSMTSGFANTSGVTWTGTLNPTVAQTNAYAANGSTTPLAAGQTAAPAGPPPPAPTAIYMNNSTVKIIRAIPTTSNSPSNEGPNNAFDNNPNTKYLNFDKQNAGVTVKLNQGRVVQKFTITTANDAVERDPTSYKLYGSNDGSSWVLISEGALSLSDSRFSVSGDIAVANTTAYAYYFIKFPSIKNNIGNSVQVSEITYYYDANSTTTSTASSNTIVDPVTAESTPALCCGGSASSFSSDVTNTAKVQAFINRTTADSQVFIEQIGNSNTIEVVQRGTRNNYTKYQSNGSFNNTVITQTSTNTTATNYTELTLNGNNNDVIITQQSTGGTKGAFVNISNNSNSLMLQQKDSGNHYTEISLSGSNKNVEILQQGSASHMARIGLTGLATDLSLTQSGSTQNFYSINFNCATAGGCPKITVQQGQ